MLDFATHYIRPNAYHFAKLGTVMNSARETLHSTIYLLSDEEIRQILAFAQNLRKKTRGSQTLKRVARDAGFTLPAEASKSFPLVKRIQGRSIAASSLLVKERQ
jgi:hypothetical protein